jgi:hypothetical protein
MIAVSSASAPTEVVNVDGYPEIEFTNFVGHYAKDDGGPQGYLVAYDEAGGTIPPHFHGVDQWQVVIDGGGRLGKHDASAVIVHYTDGYTPYGPIVAGDDGIEFYTLRVQSYLGVHVMPGSRSEMARRARRALTIAAGLKPGHPDMERSGEAVRELVTDDDGVAAWSVRLAPGATETAPSPADGGGQYHIVVNGSWTRGGEQLPPKSVAFVAPGDPPAQYEAGPDGLELVVTQFPRVPTVLGLQEEARANAAGAARP